MVFLSQKRMRRNSFFFDKSLPVFRGKRCNLVVVVVSFRYDCFIEMAIG